MSRRGYNWSAASIARDRAREAKALRAAELRAAGAEGCDPFPVGHTPECQCRVCRHDSDCPCSFCARLRWSQRPNPCPIAAALLASAKCDGPVRR